MPEAPRRPAPELADPAPLEAQAEPVATVAGAQVAGGKDLWGKVLRLRTRPGVVPPPEEERPEPVEPQRHRPDPSRLDDGDLLDDEPVAGRPLPRLPRPRRGLGGRLAAFAAIVVLPTLLAALYYFLIAAPQFVTEIRLGVRFADPTKIERSGAGAAGFAATQLGLDSYVVVQYIGSREMVDELQKQIDIRRIYSSPAADFLTRFEPDRPVEDLVAYWRKMVDPFFDLTTGMVSIKVRAFSPEESQKVADAVLAQSERLVNDMSSRARRDAVQFAEDEVKHAELRLSLIRQRLRELREKQRVLDPKTAVASSDALLAKQREELVRLNTELSTLLAYMAPNAPPIQVLRNRIKATEEQIKKLDADTAAKPSNTTVGLSSIIAEFEELDTERQFAEKAYTSTLESLEQARAAADRQLVYLATIVRPTRPESSTYPEPTKSTLLVLLAALAAWVIGTLGYYAIRDHVA